MSEYYRNCPDCNTRLLYKHISSLENANKNNSKCTACRARRYPIVYEYKRNCPTCNIEILYKTRGIKQTAEKNNAVCKNCRLKWQNNRYGNLVYEYKCPCKNCNVMKSHYTKRGITESALKKLQQNPTRLCRSCSNSLYYTPAENKKNTKPELDIKQYLDTENINYIQQYPISGSHYDFYLPCCNILIEVDGCYWHGKNLNDNELNEQQKNTRKNDYKKNSLAKQHNIMLLRIWEDEINTSFFNKIKKLYVYTTRTHTLDGSI